MWNRKALETMTIDYYDHQEPEELQEQMEGMSTDRVAREAKKAYGMAFREAYLEYGGDSEEGL